MRIAICGSHLAGKSTLADALSEVLPRNELAEVELRAEVLACDFGARLAHGTRCRPSS